MGVPLHRAELAFRLDDEAEAAAVEAAMSVEAREGPEGSRAAVRREGTTLRVDVEAGSASDLRAALHSMVRLLDAAQRTLQAGRAQASSRNR